MKKPTENQQKELENLIAEDGLLHAEAVVKFAQDRRTALHSAFEWDESFAAHQYRINQARELIRITVTILPQTNKPINAFVSIRSDRKMGGGYRKVEVVMKNPKSREEMLQAAFLELEAFKSKYAELIELADVFESIDKTIRTLEPAY